MRRMITMFLLFIGFLQLSFLEARWCCAQSAPGKTAPVFVLKDIQGKKYDLSSMQDRPLMILYFFDADSRSSQEGLLGLGRFAKNHRDSEMTVWAITRSSKKAAVVFAKQHQLIFPVLLDDIGACDQYGARVILPTVCILGPKLQVLDHIQGGGESSEALMIKLAERQLQRNHPMLAGALSTQVVKENPKNIAAKALYGYTVLKEGRLNDAEKAFKNLLIDAGSSEILGKEGLSAVYLKKGQVREAMKMAQEVERMAPERGNVNLIKGNILAAKNQKVAAQEEFNKAANKKMTDSFYKSASYNQLGQIQASLGNYQTSRDLYDKAVEINPYLVEAVSNKGVAYEREGRWDMALSSYRQALSVENNDDIAVVLAKNAEKRLMLLKDIEGKARIDKLVKELAQRYRQDKKDRHATSDAWISRPMILSFIDFTEKGGLAERDGLPLVLMAHLSDLLNASGRVRVVERIMIEQLLTELNLGSSDLANPETALRIGKLLSAKLVGTGTFHHGLTGTLLSLRLIDTETSEIMKVVTRQLKSQASLMKDIHALNRDILKDIIVTYPLKGYVVQASDHRLMLNLGARHGVVLGTVFEVLKEQAQIEYRGSTIQPDPKSIAQVEIVEVERSLCYAKVIHQQQSPEKDHLVREVIAP